MSSGSTLPKPRKKKRRRPPGDDGAEEDAGAGAAADGGEADDTPATAAGGGGGGLTASQIGGIVAGSVTVAGSIAGGIGAYFRIKGLQTASELSGTAATLARIASGPNAGSPGSILRAAATASTPLMQHLQQSATATETKTQALVRGFLGKDNYPLFRGRFPHSMRVGAWRRLVLEDTLQAEARGNTYPTLEKIAADYLTGTPEGKEEAAYISQGLVPRAPSAFEAYLTQVEATRPLLRRVGDVFSPPEVTGPSMYERAFQMLPLPIPM